MKSLKNNEIYFLDFGEIEIISGRCSHSFPVHIHKSMCVGIITNGRAEFICNGNSSILMTGDLFTIPPDNPHSISAIDGMEYSYITLCFKNMNFNRGVSDYHYTAIAKSFIESQPAHTIDLQTLSDFVHVSEFHLIREFKKAVGVSPHQFCLMEKVKKIRQGLMIQQPLSDLALSLGFSDQSHLCNTFKKFMGITPLQYKHSYKAFYNKAGENFANI